MYIKHTHVHFGKAGTMMEHQTGIVLRLTLRLTTETLLTRKAVSTSLGPCKSSQVALQAKRQVIVMCLMYTSVPARPPVFKGHSSCT